MKIARFMGYPIDKIGSLERFIHKQANRMKKDGHDIYIIYDGRKNLKVSADAEKISPGTTIIYNFIYPRRKMKLSIDYVRYLFKAYIFLRKENFDIVHSYFDPSARLLNLLAPLLKKTIFVRTMGGVPNYEDADNILCKFKKAYFLFKLINYDKIICVSETVKDALIKYKINPDRLTVIYDAVDTDHFKRYYLSNKLPSSFNLSFCGRLERVKNIECLIRGLSILKQHYNLDNIILNIYGTGSKAMLLKKLAKNENVKQNVRFHGLIHNVVKILNEKTDIYVQASFSEGLSASIIEAMSCECPVVASDIGGHKTMIDDGINGLLFDPYKPSDFAEKIYKLITSESLRNSIAFKARRTIISRFGIDERIRLENETYQLLLNGEKK